MVTTQRLLGTFLVVMTACQVGCVTYANKAVPASRVPCNLLGESETAKVPINLASLRQKPPEQHIVGAGDHLGIYVFGVLPPNDEQTIIHPERFQSNIYYPPNGLSDSPSTGVPVEVSADGHLYLPLIDPIPVAGLTIQQTAQAVVKAYGDKQLLKKGRERVTVTLIKPRVVRVLVMRGDTPGQPVLKLRGQQVLSKQGSAAVVDLPAFQNDLLHALSTTGGLPGVDAHNCIWILRNRQPSPAEFTEAQMQLDSGADPGVVLASFSPEYTRTKIPLRVCPGQALPFAPSDVVLNEGDVVFLEPRVNDFFYTGGMLPPGEIPLPRDRDIDVMEAIAIATGGVASPLQGGPGNHNYLRQGAGPGNTSIPPTRVIILRKLADGQQLRIQVDLRKAVHDARERIKILPEDFVMLQYTPGQQCANTLTHWFNWNITTVPTQLGND